MSASKTKITSMLLGGAIGCVLVLTLFASIIIITKDVRTNGEILLSPSATYRCIDIIDGVAYNTDGDSIEVKSSLYENISNSDDTYTTIYESEIGTVQTHYNAEIRYHLKDSVITDTIQDYVGEEEGIVHQAKEKLYRISCKENIFIILTLFIAAIAVILIIIKKALLPKNRKEHEATRSAEIYMTIQGTTANGVEILYRAYAKDGVIHFNNIPDGIYTITQSTCDILPPPKEVGEAPASLGGGGCHL